MEEAAAELRKQGVQTSSRSLGAYERGSLPVPPEKLKAILEAYPRIARKTKRRSVVEQKDERHGDRSDHIRVRLFDLEVAADSNGGTVPIDGVTVRTRVLEPNQFSSLYHRPPPLGPDAIRRYAVAIVRGDSMAPRYFDGDEVPVELFPEPLVDVPAGAVYVIRLEGHLYVKILDRRRTDGLDVLVLKSANLTYAPVYVPLDDGRDFAVLGRVIQTPKDQLYGALLAAITLPTGALGAATSQRGDRPGRDRPEG